MGHLIDRYYQKSLCVLYPFLELRRDLFIEKMVLNSSFLSWDETNEGIGEGMLLVHYHDVSGQNYRIYEKKYISTSQRLVNLYEVGDGKVAIFSLEDKMDVVKKFMEGKYSTLKDVDKKVIMKYWGAAMANKKLEGNECHVLLYPEYYFADVAEELGITEDYLRSVGELWSAPDLEKEHLKLTNALQLNLIL